MKALRLVLTTVVVTLMTAGLVLAQDRPDRPERGRRGERGGARAGGEAMQILNRLGELDLTAEQRTAIEKLRADFEKRMKDAREKMLPMMEELLRYRQEHPDDQEGFRKKREEMQQAAAPMREMMQ
ncbi:MAG TPA: hypothetical protein VMZ92_10065, partial [Planctomycetota bacterium]|nr:hypothetical protein [Planctomycetota bacterium]